MKKLLSLTAVALHLSISPSVNAQDLPFAEAPVLLVQLAPPAIPALPSPRAIPALAPPPAAQTKARPAARLSDLAKPIEPIMALPSALASKPAKTPQPDPLGDLIHTLMMDPLPLDDLAKPLATRPQADLAKPLASDPLGDLATILDAPLMLEPVAPASIDPLDGLGKARTQSPR